MKVLLIEDNPGDARLVQEILNQATGNFSFKVAEKLGKGLEFLASQDVDVVLLDLGLPDSLGLETLSKVQAQFPGLPVVIMTGSDDEELGIQAVQLGAQDYLVKGQADGRLLSRALAYAIERKKAEEALRRSQERNRLLADILEKVAMPFAIGFPDGSLGIVNKAFCKLTGYTSEELQHINWANVLTPPEYRAMEAEKLAGLVRTELPACYQKEYLRKDGSRVPIELLVHLVRDSEGQAAYYYSFLTDITERKKAEEALRRANEELEIKVDERTRELAEANGRLERYGHRITQLQEEEKKRIAYELHDDTAQYLSILRLEIESVLQSGKIQSTEILEKMELLRKNAERAFNDVSRHSHELRPGVLDYLGLRAALEQIADDINQLKELPVELHFEGEEPEVSEEIKLAFFRIAQEALNNARKHAKASQVTINLRFNHRRLRMEVSDDGVGFDYQEAFEKSGSQGSLGLMSMKERASLINANLKIECPPGQGTRIILKAKS